MVSGNHVSSAVHRPGKSSKVERPPEDTQQWYPGNLYHMEWLRSGLQQLLSNGIRENRVKQSASEKILSNGIWENRFKWRTIAVQARHKNLESRVR